jgi:ADP-ribosyl-[dinitrogen reductase] hydrolase
MLVEICLGDAYGACFEYADPTPDRPNDLSGYPANVSYPKIGGGRYTDDGQCSIALARAMLAGPITPNSVAQHLVDQFRADPRPGYSRRMQALMESCATGADLLACIVPTGDTSGACMRAGPLGLLRSIDAVLDSARIQARVTHDTEGGVRSAQAVALMVHAMRYGLIARPDLPGFIAAHVPGPWERPWCGEVGSLGMDAARAALWTVVGNDSLSEMLKAAVAWHGDVDTVAAIAMAVASCAADIVRDIPDPLITGFEDGAYGRRYLERLDEQLAAFVART